MELQAFLSYGLSSECAFLYNNFFIYTFLNFGILKQRCKS